MTRIVIIGLAAIASLTSAFQAFSITVRDACAALLAFAFPAEARLPRDLFGTIQAPIVIGRDQAREFHARFLARDNSHRDMPSVLSV